MNNRDERTSQAASVAQPVGEIIISGVDTGTPVGTTPTEMHALFQGLLEVTEPLETEEEDI